MLTLSLFLLIIVIPFVTMPRDIRKSSVSPYFTVLRSILTTMVALMAIMAMAKITGNPLFETYHDGIVKVCDNILNNENLRSMVGLSDVSDAKATDTLITLYDGMIMRMPGYLILITTIVSYFDYIILSRSFAKRQQVRLMPKFREFSFPNNIVMAMVVMYFLAWFMSKGDFPAGDAIYANINYLFDMVFAIQGAAVIFMFCHLKRMPKAVPVIAVIFFWNVYLLREMMLIIGMMDLIFGIRNFLVFKEQLREQNKRDGNNDRK